MKLFKISLISCICFFASPAFALQPEQILIVANENSPDSVQLAKYYALKRSVPQENIIYLTLGKRFSDDIKRDNYNTYIADPIRKKLSSPPYSENIKCLLTLYGVPFKLGPRQPIGNQNRELFRLQQLKKPRENQLTDIVNQLRSLDNPSYRSPANASLMPNIRKTVQSLRNDFEDAFERLQHTKDESVRQQYFKKYLDMYAAAHGKVKAIQFAKSKAGANLQLTEIDQLRIKEKMKFYQKANSEKWSTAKKLDGGYYEALENIGGLSAVLIQLTNDIDLIKGIETGASVDSELSMVMFDDYELYRFQPNELKQRILWLGVKTLMVSRIDAPDSQIAKGLIDKAIIAEIIGLNGNVYLDSGKSGGPIYEIYDQSIKGIAELFEEHPSMRVTQEQSSKLFAPGQCPETAIYCGWYSLRRYVDAFDYVDGAVGFHIASLEATDLRSKTSLQWCPAMLRDGITATIGAVAEPYLTAFPYPRDFFYHLLKGKPIVEAYYKTKPYNSWQMILIADPLYTPFKSSGGSYRTQ